jgi:hypothetical protein
MEARDREEVFETPDAVPDVAFQTHTQQQPQPHHLSESDPENVVPTPLDADAAFEVFHGKRYETRGLPGACLHASVDRRSSLTDPPFLPIPQTCLAPSRRQQRRRAGTSNSAQRSWRRRPCNDTCG